MCLNCVTSFLSDPIKLGVVLVSVLMAVVLLFVFIKKRKTLTNNKKLAVLYSIIFFSAFPFIFFFYGKTCKGAFYSCNIIQSIVNSIVATFVISMMLSFIATPFIYKYSSRSKRIAKIHPIFRFVKYYAQQLKIKIPQIYLLDKVQPAAFSFSHISPRIFMTVGLVELLQPKELQAVLLHELGHIKQRSSFLKFTNSLLKILVSPIANFNVLHNELDREEQEADQVAINIQKTKKHILSAKKRINKFIEEAKKISCR